jgi:hypothetical protein
MIDEPHACIDATLSAAHEGEWAEALRWCTSSRSVDVALSILPELSDAMLSAEGVLPSHFTILRDWVKQLDFGQYSFLQSPQVVQLDVAALLAAGDTELAICLLGCHLGDISTILSSAALRSRLERDDLVRSSSRLLEALALLVEGKDRCIGDDDEPDWNQIAQIHQDTRTPFLDMAERCLAHRPSAVAALDCLVVNGNQAGYRLAASRAAEHLSELAKLGVPLPITGVLETAAWLLRQGAHDDAASWLERFGSSPCFAGLVDPIEAERREVGASAKDERLTSVPEGLAVQLGFDSLSERSPWGYGFLLEASGRRYFVAKCNDAPAVETHIFDPWRRTRLGSVRDRRLLDCGLALFLTVELEPGRSLPAHRASTTSLEPSTPVCIVARCSESRFPTRWRHRGEVLESPETWTFASPDPALVFVAEELDGAPIVDDHGHVMGFVTGEHFVTGSVAGDRLRVIAFTSVEELIGSCEKASESGSTRGR